MRLPNRILRFAKSRSRVPASAVRSVLRRFDAALTGVAHRAEISDGHTLNVDVELHAPVSTPAFVLVDHKGGEVGVFRVLRRSPTRFTLTADLRAGRVFHTTGLLRVALAGKGRHLFLAFDGNPKFLNGDITVRYPLCSPGKLARPVSDLRGRLGVHVSANPIPLALIAIRPELYRIRLELSSDTGAIRSVACRLRGGETEFEARVIEQSEDGRELVVDLPLEALARNREALAGSDSSVWRIIGEVEGEAHDARLVYSDLSNPRHAIRYPTLVLAAARRRDRFRPYWTIKGNLVLEHKHADFSAEEQKK